MIQTLLRIQLSVAGTGSTGNNLDSTSEERELETEIAILPIIDPLDVREFVWNPKDAYVATKESFIFALDKHIDKSIVTFVDNSNDSYKKAFYDGRNCFPTFGGGHDLFFGNNTHGIPYAKKLTYILPIRDTSDGFEWVDWEVFLVSKL